MAKLATRTLFYGSHDHRRRQLLSNAVSRFGRVARAAVEHHTSPWHKAQPHLRRNRRRRIAPATRGLK